MNLKNRTIAVIGLGYVGLPLAVEFGKKRPVIGFDIKTDRIAELQAGHDHTLEVSEEELKEAKFLTFTSDPSSLRPNSSSRGARHPEPAEGGRGGAVAIDRAQPVGIATPASRSRNDGGGFYCGYSPERINPGDKTHRLPQIKKVTSGSTPEIAQAVDELYKEIITAGTHMASSIKVAEAAKVIENAQRDLNIAFVNELSVIFSRIGIDTTEVLTAAATKWNFLPFKPGLVGGHCIGVDPYYLTHKAQELGYRPQVILSGRAINDNMGRYAARNVVRLMLRNGINVANATVGVLGMTFKENCPDVRNSKVIDIVRELQQWGVQVKVMDPWADPQEVQEEYGVDLTWITPEAPVDSLIIAVAHQEFASMSPAQLKALCAAHSKPVIADLKALHDRKALDAQGFAVFRF